MGVRICPCIKDQTPASIAMLHAIGGENAWRCPATDKGLRCNRGIGHKGDHVGCAMLATIEGDSRAAEHGWKRWRTK